MTRSAGPGSDRISHRADIAALAWAAANPRVLDLTALGLVLVGGLLRFYRSTALSLWLDEGFTILFSRLPWAAVAGLQGAYDTHPPLYYVLVKVAASLLPEPEAARYLSVVAGTLTLPVLYLLVTRLLGRPAALVALFVAAFSPLLLWYSQEARQYAVTGLAVALSYLALVSFYQAPRIRLAATYGISVAVAMYLDYSALYALVPQIAVVVIIWRHHGLRRMLPLLVAGVSAVVAYLPWVPQVVGTIRELGGGRTGYLAADAATVPPAVGSVLGLVGQGVYFAGTSASAWDRWPSLQGAFGAAVVMAVLLGLWALARRRLALATVVGLAAGTVIVAILASQVSPGFAPRTVSYAVLGWAIFPAAAVADRSAGLARRALAVACVAALVGAGLVSVVAIYKGGDKEHWRNLAADVASVEGFGFPVVLFPSVAPTLLDVYEPGIRALQPLELGDVPDLGALDRTVAGRPAVWVASYGIPALAQIGQRLGLDGFTRVAHRWYPYVLSLDLYVRAGSVVGAPMTMNGAFAGPAGSADGWLITPGPATFVATPTGRQLILPGTGTAENAAVSLLPAKAGRLYTLDLEARADITQGGPRMFLICSGPSGFLDVAPDGAGASIPSDGSWHRVTIATFCPAGTDAIRVDLRNAGVGTLDLRDVRVLEASPHAP